MDLLLAILLIFGCVAVWTVAAMRWRRGLSVIPWQPRHRVPWGAADVLLVFILCFLVARPIILRLSERCLGVGPSDFPQPAANAPCDADHPLMQMLRDGDVGTILLAAVSAIVVAPVTEEFLFRLLLQGWLESFERQLRCRIPRLRRMAAGVVPVTTVALLFAAIHYRLPEPRRDLSLIVFSFEVQAACFLLTVVAAVCWLRFFARATPTDLGVVPDRLASDLRLGLVGFLAVAVPVFGIHAGVKACLPENVVADPTPLFFLGLALGIFYYRTHRIIPSIIAHAAFNAVSVLAMIGARG
jgi:membrane protease YdiL (CAAX protease family)